MKRSKRYQDQKAKIKDDKLYSLKETIDLVKETSTTKFPGSVELHIRLGIDVSKSDQIVRSTVSLPHGSGKQVRIAVFGDDKAQKEAKEAGADVSGGEELINNIKKSGKIDFDVAIATPDTMRHMAQIAKILGPKGIMPSPKNETVTTDIKKTVEELKKGKVAFKNDDTGNIHLVVGKVDFSPEQLNENIEVALDAVRKAKPSASKGTYIKGIVLNATMGPGIPMSIL